MKLGWTPWLVVIVMAAASLATVTACGDDDDDDDDDTGGSGSYATDCESLLEEFFAGGGVFGDCYDEEEALNTLIEECPKFDTADQELASDSIDCMEGLDCGSYDDYLGLYEDVLDCMGPTIGDE
ncbi:MAG: hypothetical protein KJ042_15340 [Deltaproteobacteria bacterium]|nr:hypothetical protein [Deltaproteobacteria bacterium]